MRTITIPMLLGMTVFAALLAEPAVATTSAPNGQIYYVDPESNLRAANPDGTAADFEPIAGVSSADVSPDGTMLLVALNSGALQVRSVGGGEPRTIESGVEDVRSVAWAPDGQRFAFVGFGSTTGIQVYVGDLQGATPTNLTPDTGSRNQAPAWSTDGSTIYFYDGDSNLSTVPAAGGAVTELAAFSDSQFIDRGLDTHPDGQRLMVGCFDDGGLVTQCVTDQAGAVLGRLTTPTGLPNPDGRFSPDGQQIVFQRGASSSGPLEIVTAPLSDLAAQTLVAAGLVPDWAPQPSTPPPPAGPPPSNEPLAPGGFDRDPATAERADFVDPSLYALAVSQARFLDGAAAHAVLSRDDQFADSLAGAPLTADGPLLFTPTATLPQATLDEIRRAVGDGGVVYLLGGSAAISDGVQAQLTGAGFDVRRLAGGSRVETSVAVARQVIDLGGDRNTIAVARAGGPPENPTAAWADSVSGGAWAAGAGVGLVVTDTASVHPAVAVLLSELAPQRTVLLGGDAALSPAVEADVPNPDRVFGNGRAATAAAVARELVGIQRPGPATFVAVNVGRTDGWLFGLASAGVAADADGALLAVGDTAPAESLALACNPDSVELLVAGHTDVVAESVLAELDGAGAC